MTKQELLDGLTSLKDLVIQNSASAVEIVSSITALAKNVEEDLEVWCEECECDECLGITNEECDCELCMSMLDDTDFYDEDTPCGDPMCDICCPNSIGEEL